MYTLYSASPDRNMIEREREMRTKQARARQPIPPGGFISRSLRIDPSSPSHPTLTYTYTSIPFRPTRQTFYQYSILRLERERERDNNMIRSILRPSFLPPLRSLRSVLSVRHIRSTPPSGAAPGHIPFDNMTIPSSSQGVSVAGLVRSGIELSDGMVVGGSMILLGGKTFLWGVDRLRLSPSQSTTAAIGGLDGQTQGEWDWRWVGWNEEIFKVLEVCGPRPEMLIFGTGKTVLPAPPFLRNYLNGLGIQLDIMNTRDACSTYNMLAEEGRLVAAALLSVNPPPASTRSAADEFSVLAGAFRSGNGEGGRRPVDV